MLGTLLLIALAAYGPVEDEGEVAATAGVVTLHREGKAYRAEPRAALRPGDRLETADNGGASLLLPGGGAMDLGPGSVATLGGGDGRSVALAKGEARAVVAERPLSIVAPGASVMITRGIVRASASPQSMRVMVDAGSAEVSGASGKGVALADGQESSIPNGGEPSAPIAAKSEGWLFQGEALRMATAADTSRRSKQKMAGDATDSVAKTFRPSGQSPENTGTGTDEAGQPAMPNPNATPDENAPANPDPNAINAPNADDAESIGANSSVTQPAATSAISLALGNSSASVGAGSSGGDFSDAQQDSRTTQTVAVPGNPFLPLAGNIHIIAAQKSYTLNDVKLSARDSFPLEREYWSIGIGPSPTKQVVTTFKTASDPIPQVLRIPRTDAYLVRFPQSNYGIRDPALGGVGNDVSGISGLTGEVPIAPQVSNATPLIDSRAVFNNRATFALGDFALQRSAKDNPQIDIRRGDQDRQIIKSPDGNDQNDKVTLNPQVKFEAVSDPKFFPELPAVSRPAGNNPVSNQPTYASLSQLRKAGTTTLMADKLSDFSRRTGRTRFVLGGQVVDITGYRQQANTPMREVMRSPAVGVQGTNAGARGARFGHQR